MFIHPQHLIEFEKVFLNIIIITIVYTLLLFQFCVLSYADS